MRGWFELLRVAHRTLYLQALWTHEKMQSIGYLGCLLPFARRRFPQPDERNAFLRRETGFFNTNPFVAGWIVGAAMEHEEHAGDPGGSEAAEQELRRRRRLSEPLAAVGDQLFWGRIKPLAALLGFSVSLQGGVAGVPVFLALFNLPALFARVGGVWYGYKQGFDGIKRIISPASRSLLRALMHVSAFAAGCALLLSLGSEMAGTTAQRLSLLGSVLLTYILMTTRATMPVILLVLLISGSVAGFFLS